MPYVKTDKPFAKMRRLLLGYEVDAVALSEIIGCSYNTARTRIDNPERLTLSELDAINRKGHIPIEEIREAISR